MGTGLRGAGTGRLAAGDWGGDEGGGGRCMKSEDLGKIKIARRYCNVLYSEQSCTILSMTAAKSTQKANHSGRDLC